MILKNCNSKEFIKILNGRKVICFGAGLKLGIALSRGNNIECLENHIAFFVDNDPNKNGTKYTYNKKEFNIYSPEVFYKIDVSKYVLLITVNSHLVIYEQLDKMEILNDLECYIYDSILLAPDIDISNLLGSKQYYDNKKNYKDKLRKFKNIHKGQRCFIIGNGPSLNVEDLEMLKNEVTFAVNRIYLCFDRTDWRPTYYTCVDQNLYSNDYKIINAIQVKYKFISYNNIIFSEKIHDDIIYFDEDTCISTIVQNRLKIKENFKFSFDISDVIFNGNTVLYDVVQIAVYMGFSEIYLLGVDCNFQTEILPDGTIIKNNVHNHFIKEYDNGFENIMSAGMPIYRMQIAWQSAKEACEKVGVTIKNATRGGKLKVFERVDFDELMKDKEVF